jgi:putative PIN family toxin of toxin-antitoxin system
VVRVTFDTNILISALAFGGIPRQLLNMAEEGTIRLALSDAILDEMATVLGRPKFGWPQERIDAAIKQISSFAEHVEPMQSVDVVKEDPTDNRIVECATASGSEYLVSGDKHLLKIGQYQGFKIVPSAEFIEIQAQAGRKR